MMDTAWLDQTLDLFGRIDGLPRLNDDVVAFRVEAAR
jgi:hypothetical protein